MFNFSFDILVKNTLKKNQFAALNLNLNIILHLNGFLNISIFLLIY